MERLRSGVKVAKTEMTFHGYYAQTDKLTSPNDLCSHKL